MIGWMRVIGRAIDRTAVVGRGHHLDETVLEQRQVRRVRRLLRSRRIW